MLLTVGYGAIELFLPRSKAVTSLPGQSTEGLNAFIGKVSDAVRTATADASATVIQKAEAAWKQDPFMVIRKAQTLPAEKSPVKEPVRPLPAMTYSGFLEIGSKRLAIINGMEYEAGDKLSVGRVTIKSFCPTR
jgi:hypothetical protein